VREVEVYREDPKMAEFRIAYGSLRERAKQLEVQLAAKDDELTASYKRLDVVAGEVKERQAAQVRVLEGRVKYLYEQVETLGLDLEDERQRNGSLTMQIAVMQKFIEHEIGAPGYSVAVKKDDREDVARRLLVEKGWSRRKIQRWLYGYTGGAACRKVQRALADPKITGQGTAIVPYKERFQGLEWVLPGALLGL